MQDREQFVHGLASFLSKAIHRVFASRSLGPRDEIACHVDGLAYLLYFSLYCSLLFLCDFRFRIVRSGEDFFFWCFVGHSFN